MPPPEIRKFLYDAQAACEALIQFIRDKSLADYRADLLLRSGVERQLMIVGEALHQGLKTEPTLTETITDIRQIINLRHIIVHGYASIEDETVWGTLQNDVPVLHQQIRRLLGEGTDRA